MSRRILSGVDRGTTLHIQVDGITIAGFEGETVAATMLAGEHSGFRRDGRGRPRGLLCNMGTCSECFVTLLAEDGARRRVRACLTPATHGLRITTEPSIDG